MLGRASEGHTYNHNFNRRLLDFGWEAAISSIKIYADHILPTIVETRVLKFIDI
jgi:hypothetical protein